MIKARYILHTDKEGLDIGYTYTRYFEGFPAIIELTGRIDLEPEADPELDIMSFEISGVVSALDDFLKGHELTPECVENVDVLQEKRFMAGSKEDKKIQKDLKAEYRRELEKVWKTRKGDIDTKMVDYCVKEAQRIVRLSDGMLYAIEKPSIETRFCFAEGVQCQTSYNEAAAMAKHARTSVSYFLEENRKNLSEQFLNLYDDRWAVYVCPDARGVNIAHLEYARYGDRSWRKDYPLITDADRFAIAFEIEAAMDEHEKRLQAYLKRYGLSKVESWVYWGDE